MPPRTPPQSRSPTRAAIPATIGTLPRREALAFLSLFFVPGVGQAILLTVVPLEALDLLGSAWAVTLLYVGTGLVAVAARFSIPYLLRLVRRRFVFTLGTLSLAVSSILLAFNEVPALAASLVLSTFAFACIEITSQLYLLDRVPRHALKHFEPIRIFASAGPWTVGPWFGVYLQRTLAFAAPFGIAAGAALILLILFWSLRLGENAALTSMRRLPPNPVRYLRRFFAQPRLRLAWTLAATLLLVEHVLRLRADFRSYFWSRRRGWRHRGVYRHRLDLAGALLGLGGPPLWPASLVAGWLCGGGRSEHLRCPGVRHALARRDLACVGGSRHPAPGTCCSCVRSTPTSARK